MLFLSLTSNQNLKFSQREKIEKNLEEAKINRSIEFNFLLKKFDFLGIRKNKDFNEKQFEFLIGCFFQVKSKKLEKNQRKNKKKKVNYCQIRKIG